MNEDSTPFAPAFSLGADTALTVTLVLAIFAIFFGARHVDVTETHQGMVLAIAFESVVKLLAFVDPGTASGASMRAGLAAMGHPVKPAEAPFGGGQAVVIDRQSGFLIGGSDPRKDGCALGW